MSNDSKMSNSVKIVVKKLVGRQRLAADLRKLPPRKVFLNICNSLFCSNLPFIFYSRNSLVHGEGEVYIPPPPKKGGHQKKRRRSGSDEEDDPEDEDFRL